MIKGREGDPGFKRLGRQGRGGRAGFGKGVLPVEDEASILDDGAAVELGVELADEVASVLFESPPVARRRARALLSLEAAAEIIG